MQRLFVVLGQKSFMRKLVVTSLMTVVVLLGSSGESFAQRINCTEDSLSTNNNGEFLMTLSGKLFETLAGDSIDAMLWLPTSSLTVCGPTSFTYKGKNYAIYKIINTDDGEKVDAFLVNQRGNSAASNGGCYNSTIRKPTPFMGNNDEIFVLSDGSVWQVKYEYEYMYEYYPSVVACPNKGYVIVNGKKIDAHPLR
jgi:hypothetical protein